MDYDEQKEKDMAEIRAIIRENAKSIEQTRSENAKSLERTQAAIEKNVKMVSDVLAESVKNTKKWKEESQNRLNKLEGDEGNRLGELVETITRENIERLLKDYGINVERVQGNVRDVNRRWELDAMAVNGEEIVIVEAKATFTCGGVRAFIDKALKNARTYVPEHGDKKIYGAIAYFKSKNSQRYGDPMEYALKEGLFVINVVGDTARICNGQNFRPKAF